MCDLQDGDKWRRLWCEELGKAEGEIGRAGCGLDVGRKAGEMKATKHE